MVANSTRFSGAPTEQAELAQVTDGLVTVSTCASATTRTDKLYLRTLGHACAVLCCKGEPPLLATDPWLVGSVYWRSWWLQNYPSADEIDWLAKSARIYITHEHPDHFNMPTIRRLGYSSAYLFPALAERGYLDYM